MIFSRVCGLLPPLTCWPMLVQAGFPTASLLLITARALAVGRKEKGISKKNVKSSLPNS